MVGRLHGRGRPQVGAEGHPGHESLPNPHCALGQVFISPSSQLHRIPNSSCWFYFFFPFLVTKQNQSFKNQGPGLQVFPQGGTKPLGTLSWKERHLQAQHTHPCFEAFLVPVRPLQKGSPDRGGVGLRVNRPGHSAVSSAPYSFN